MKNGVIMFLGGLALFAIILSIFSQLKTDQPISRNKDSNRLNILGNNTEESPTEEPMQEQNQAPEMTIDVSKKYTAVMETDKGTIIIELTADQTPVTVNNFVTLARKGFYDNTIFHRVIEGFMIQGGDPKGDGTGGPGYRFDDEPFEGEYTRGTLAMANAGPNTNGSQFFIVHQDSTNLPKNYVIFGRVVEGMDVVDEIAQAEVTTSPSGEQSKPVDPVKIISITIEESAGEASQDVLPNEPSPGSADTSDPEQELP